jgi:hypothetical protein
MRGEHMSELLSFGIGAWSGFFAAALCLRVHRPSLLGPCMDIDAAQRRRVALKAIRATWGTKP